MAIVLITGAYPTSTPAVLGATKVIAASGRNADLSATVTLGTGTITLIGWHLKTLTWKPLIDVTLDVNQYGGEAYGRCTPGWGLFSHFAVWEKVAGATATYNIDVTATR